MDKPCPILPLPWTKPTPVWSLRLGAAHRTGKQPQRRAASESPRDPPPHFDLDAGDHDNQDPPVDPDDPGADNDNPDNDNLDDDSGGLPCGEPGDPSGPGGPGGPRSPISPDIPNEQRAMLELLLGFKGSILAALGRPSDSSESKSKVKEPEVFDGSDPQKLKTFFVNLALVFNDRPKYFTNQRKVNYTLSYLSGSAKEWTILVYNAQGEAKDSLGNLKMKETKHIRFNTLAASTNWDSAALKWAYG
ncbi:retrotransposon nucleocapsid protein [Lentinula edodes]|uniref:Retrotransposon nucleocapsid protein n=1 Tax=Lentinula edodes TaxID=5353 RepID=A0A1Q3EI48_LENED|nr:retrotransposon nucleocapsid protein [Lentinula edodes]